MPYTPQPSPDGSRVVYLVSELDEDSKEYRRHLWCVPAAGGPTRQLTFDAGNPAEPRWSPDGASIAFPAKRDDDERQVWLLPADGGEARRLTRQETGAHSIDWSPHGTRLRFLSQEPPGAAVAPAPRKPSQGARAPARGAGAANGASRLGVGCDLEFRRRAPGALAQTVGPMDGG